MLRKILALSLFFSSSFLSVFARQLTASEALARAGKGVAKMPSVNGASASKMHLDYTASKDGLNLFYILSNENDGKSFILSADDLMPPVLAYGITTFDVNDMPAQVRNWMEYYEEVAMNMISHGKALAPKVIESTPVEPLLKTKWGQDAPYNDVCVKETAGNMPTGCVATAMAQVMAYWKWPVKGEGTHSYLWDDKKTLSANFGSTTYAWNDMLEAFGYYYPEGSAKEENMEYTPEQAEAVSTLMYHCGVSVEMSYAESGSGSPVLPMLTALYRYFGYDKEMVYLKRDWYCDEEWQQIIIDELIGRRPVIYSGSTTDNSGHCFVCDGYDGKGYFHFNWGWDGLGDGYYMVVGDDPLHPATHGTGGSSVHKPFVAEHDILIGIQPAKSSSKYRIYMSADDVLESSQGNVSSMLVDDDDKEIVGAVQRGKTYNMFGFFVNFHYLSNKFDLGVILRHKESGNEYVCSAGEIADIPSRYGGELYPVTFDAALENGEYELYPAYRTSVLGIVDGPWRKMLYPIDVKPYQITLEGETPSFVVTDSHLNSENGYVTENPELSVTLKALRDFDGLRLHASVYGNDDTALNAFVISNSISMKAGEVRTFDNIKLRNNRFDKPLVHGKDYIIDIESMSEKYLFGDWEYVRLFCCVNKNLVVGVESVTEEAEPVEVKDQRIYNLNGQVVTRLKPGVYVKNGRKFIVK